MEKKLDFIPLCIGIAGHRDIRDADKPKLKQLIKILIEEKVAQCPNTPIVILTPLAEGADRIAAYAALECGISFIAPLPMPVDEYRKDFKTQESLNEFNELLGKAENWFELPVPDGSKVKELQHNKEKRDDQYYNIGFFIARQSQLLIALWDGIENNKRGGTAHVVHLKMTGLPSVNPHAQQLLRNPQTGPVYHILTPHKSVPVITDAFKGSMIYADYWGKNDARSIEMDQRFLSHIDSFNRDVKTLTPELRIKIEQSERQLLNEDAITRENAELQKIAGYYAVSDILATYFQSRRFFALKILLILTVIAFIFFQVYVEFWHKPAILLLYPLTMGMGALSFLNATRKRFEQKHEDYRALSEAFRVQYFLNIAQKKVNVSDYYLQKHKGELEWVIYALRASLLIASATRKDKTSHINESKMILCKYINEHWVLDQLQYYKQTGKKYQIHLERLKHTANGLFILAIAAAILLFLFSILTAHLPTFIEHYHELIHSILVVCTHIFLVISAAILGYNEKMIFSEQSKICQQMVQLFSIGNKKLTNAIETDNYEEASEVIWELALESLIENADWLLLHRSRPLELPKG